MAQPKHKDAAALRDPVWLGGDIAEALVQIRTPAYLLDRTGLIRWENARAIELVGAHRGRFFASLVAPEFMARTRLEIAKKIVGSARTSDYESMLRSRSGEFIPVEIHAVALHDGNEVVGIFGIADVVEDRSTRLRQSAALTPRQHEVLRSLARGRSTAQIAESLHLSRETVRNHVRGLLRALHTNSRLAAIAEARRRGLVD